MCRSNVDRLNDIPNIGPAMQRDLNLLGITAPQQLIGRDPYKLYDDLCRLSGQRHDPCVLDIFISAVRYMEGAPALKWWAYTAERKRNYKSS